MSQKGSVVFILIIAILIPLFFLSIGYLIGSRTTAEKANQEVINLKTQNPSSNSQCEYKILDKTDYLPSYIVKQGDTLLQISKKYFGSTDRISEIVTLNEQTYNKLRFSYDLEVGWLLYLPPKFAFPSSGNIWGYAGRILNETDSYWDFSTVNIESNNLDYKLFKDPKTQYFGKTAFHTGDCVRVIIDGADKKVIAISSQDKSMNYFQPL